MPAPSNTGSRATRLLLGTLVAIATGVLAAVFGTIMQAQILYVGQTPLPWGAVLALVMAASLAVIAGLYSERVWAAALCGVLTYVLVAWTALDVHNHLLIGWSNRETLPGPALAGTLWTYGIAVSTIVALIITAGGLRSSARKA